MPQQQEKAPEQAYLGFDLSTQKVMKWNIYFKHYIELLGE